MGAMKSGPLRVFDRSLGNRSLNVCGGCFLAVVWREAVCGENYVLELGKASWLVLK